MWAGIGLCSLSLRTRMASLTSTFVTRRRTLRGASPGASAGGDSDGPSYHPAISGDGRYVAFVSEASNLTRDSSSRAAQIFVHDLVTGITELVSRTPNGRPANGASLRPALSHDGSRVAFQSLACNLICEGKCQGWAARHQSSLGRVRL